MFRKLISFSGECNLQRNGVEVVLAKNKSKTKTFRLGTTQNTTELPTSQTTYFNVMVGNTEEILCGFKVDDIKKLHANFIKQGKITLQVCDKPTCEPKKTHFPSDMCLKEAIPTERYLFIMINGVSPEILDTFCKLLAEIKNRKSSPKETKTSPQVSTQNSVPNTTPGIPLLEKISQESKEVSIAKLARKSTIENENSKYKVNRGILGEISRTQSTSSLKRLHSNLSTESKINVKEIAQNTKKVKTFAEVSVNILKYLPGAVIKEILRYLTPKEYINQKLISKEFNSYINNLRLTLDFRGKGDLPPYIVVKYLNNSPNLERLYLGQSKLLTQRQVLDEVHFSFKKLKFLDLTYFPTLTDKIVAKIYYNCKALQTIKFGYYSQITDNVLDTLPTFLQEVKEVNFKSPNKQHAEKKEKLHDGSFAKFVQNYSKLCKFSLYICSSHFFSKAFVSPLENLTILKFEHIILNKEENLEIIHNLIYCPNLEFLKIGNIAVQDRTLVNFSKERSQRFRTTFQALTKLKDLKLGQFTSNHLMLEIANHVPNLNKLVVQSDTVDDEGMTHVLKKAELLMHLDISKCRMINGHCLEEITSRVLRKLIVQFDEYKCRGVQELLLEQGLLGQIELVNTMKKRR